MSRTLKPAIVPTPGWPLIPGYIHYLQGRYAEYLQWAEDGLREDPESLVYHGHRFIHRTLHGDWENAWSDWEYRGSRPPLRERFSASPEWTGEPIPGKTLLVLGEVGIGDELMFSRWLDKALTLSGARIVFVVRPELRRWKFGPEERLSIVARGESIPAFDSWIGLESLPLVTRTPFPPAAGSSREAQDVQLVGICWRGDPNAVADSKRSTPLSLWRPLLQMPGLHFRSLQYGDPPDQGPDIKPAIKIEPLGPVTDMTDTARRMEDLDLVITVDTSIAHLAGTMGIPVWMLQYHPPEWRWGLTGERTVWYESMRIFRQETRGEWAPVFHKLQAELEKVAAHQSF